MQWYFSVLKNYTGFSGRARRKEYWMFTLINLIAVTIMGVVDSMIFGQPSVLYAIYLLATFLPTLAVTMRRLHDTNRTGWWCLAALIPLVGFVVLVFLCLDSKEDNSHGVNPKSSTA